MTTTRIRVVCEAHGLTNPCGSCASDHLAGDHQPGDRRATCRKCRAACRKPRTPPTYQPPPMPDYAALAANDDTDYLEDDDDD